MARTDEDYLRLAIRKAREGIAAGQTPFGTVIVRGDAVIAEVHNTVWRDGDPTAHAEVNGIRQAAKAIRNIQLTGCTLYSTCEPCPMCLSAIHWAHIARVVFGASIADAQGAGFNELPIGARKLVQLGGSHLELDGGLLRDECAALFDEWRKAGHSQAY